MANPALAQDTYYAQGSNSSTNTTGAFGSNNTAGNLIVVVVITASAITLNAITDSNGNTYQQYAKNTSFGSNYYSVFYAYNIAGGANTVTVQFNTTGWQVAWIAREYSGIATTSPLDQSANATGNSTALSVSTATADTSTNGDLVVCAGFVATNLALSVGTGFTDFNSKSATYVVGIEDQLKATTGTRTGTMTIAGAGAQWVGVLLTFKSASAIVIASTANHNLLLMGVGS